MGGGTSTHTTPIVINNKVGAMVKRPTHKVMEADYDNFTRHGPSGTFYIDHCFRAKEETLSMDSADVNWMVQWKRPYELSRQPKINTNMTDIVQGELQDCWFVATLASFVSHARKYGKVKEKIMPSPIILDGHKGYDGSVKFSFWEHGDWVEIIIDDLLPMVIDPITCELTCLYGHSKDREEFWCALVEKAYAKLRGWTYQSISRGYVCDAMENLTGCMAIAIQLGRETPRDAFETIKRALDNDSIVGAATSEREDRPIELVANHAYTVTRVEQETGVQNTEYSIWVRNPWGQDDEKQQDGEEKISLENFIKYFSQVYICRFGENRDGGPAVSDKLFHEHIHGEWKESSRGGWSDEKLRPTNPQYQLHIPDDGKAAREVHIALMQQDLTGAGIPNNRIGYRLYELNKEHSRALSSFDGLNLLMSTDHEDGRKTYGSAMLNPGSYLLVGSTEHPHQTGKFLFRVLSECGKVALRLLDL